MNSRGLINDLTSDANEFCFVNLITEQRSPTMQERGYQDEERQNRRDMLDRDRGRRDFDDRTFGRNDRMNRGDRDLDRWG
jgi:hypothetical protein